MKKLSPKEVAAVAKTLSLITDDPPSGESWNRPGDKTLAGMLTSWLKEHL